MSPEQALGTQLRRRPFGHLLPRVRRRTGWSPGQLVFPGRTAMETITQHTHSPPWRCCRCARSSRFPRRSIAVAPTCLEKRPDMRPATAAVLAQQLRAIDTGRSWTPDVAAAVVERPLSESIGPVTPAASDGEAAPLLSYSATPTRTASQSSERGRVLAIYVRTIRCCVLSSQPSLVGLRLPGRSGSGCSTPKEEPVGDEGEEGYASLDHRATRLFTPQNRSPTLTRSSASETIQAQNRDVPHAAFDASTYKISLWLSTSRLSP